MLHGKGENGVAHVLYYVCKGHPIKLI